MTYHLLSYRHPVAKVPFSGERKKHGAFCALLLFCAPAKTKRGQVIKSALVV